MDDTTEWVYEIMKPLSVLHQRTPGQPSDLSWAYNRIYSVIKERGDNEGSRAIVQAILLYVAAGKEGVE